MIILSNAQRRALLAALKVADGFLDGLMIHLYKNQVSIDADTVKADFEEADFAGYAHSTAVVWGTPLTVLGDTAEMVGDVKEFVCTGPTPTNTVYGYYATVGADGALVFAEEFTSPQAVTAVGDGVVLLPRFTFGQ